MKKTAKPSQCVSNTTALTVVVYMQEFQKLLIICPCCGEIVRVADLKLSYRGREERSWYGDLLNQDRVITKKEESFDSRESKLKEKAREKGKKYLYRDLRKTDEIVKKLDYHPQDIKSIFSPVNFVVFDGMTVPKKVKEVVFMDKKPDSHDKERIHSSLRKSIKSGNYEWITITLDSTGKLIHSDRYCFKE